MLSSKKTDRVLPRLKLFCSFHYSTRRLPLILHHFNTHGFLKKYLNENIMGKDNLAKNIKSTEHFNHSECKSCQKPKRNPEKLCTRCLEKFIQLLENENFQCLVCDKVFDEKSGIISHIDETHWSESENSQNKNDKKNVESSEVTTTMNKNEIYCR